MYPTRKFDRMTFEKDSPFGAASSGRLGKESVPFATSSEEVGPHNGWTATAVTEPYKVAVCYGERDFELHIQSEILPERQEHWRAKKSRAKVHDGPLRNVLHIMFDSTSLRQFRRSAANLTKWLEEKHRLAADTTTSSGDPESFTFHHYHSVSCCSPGNQIPMYAGVINGEGDRFVAAEPELDSKDWIWNVANALGYTTFFSLDNCPDKVRGTITRSLLLTFVLWHLFAWQAYCSRQRSSRAWVACLLTSKYSAVSKTSG